MANLLIGIENNTIDNIILHLVGRCDIESSNLLDEAFNRQIIKNPAVIYINFAQLVFLDSTGIATLVKLFNVSRRVKVKLVLYNISDSLMTFFNISKLNNCFVIIRKPDLKNIQGIA